MADATSSSSTSAPVSTTTAPATPTGAAITPAQVPPSVQAAAAAGGKATTPVAAKAPEAPKSPTTAEIRKLKLKLNGADTEMTEDEVIRLAQQGGAASKRFEEAAAIRKQAEMVAELMKNNTAEAMKRLGIDPRKFSEEFLVEALKREAESPEQKNVRETREKLAAYEKAEADRAVAQKRQAEEAAKLAKQQEMHKKESEIIAKYDAMFVSALEKTGLPKNAQTVHRMATLMKVNLNNARATGTTPYSAEQLAEVVKQDYDTEFTSRTSSLEGEQLIEALEKMSPGILKKLTKAQIAMLKAKPLQHTSPNPHQPVTDAKEDLGVHKSWRGLQKARRKFQ